MTVPRAVGRALLVGVTGLSLGVGPGLGTVAQADRYPDGQPPVHAAARTVRTSGGTARPAAATVTSPASTAVQAATALGFYWQLTMAQPVLAGSVLLADRATGASGHKRSGHTDEEFFRISRTGSNNVPETAMRAYRRAAANVARTDPACHLSWTLLAGIGRVESDHGRFDGAQLGTDGVSRPRIVGPRLDGSGAFAAIADSDNGKYDGDTSWDRAVGQMQFLPSTWKSVARDGDGDGRRDPFDIDDSALGAAVYLCGAGDLSATAGMARAAYRYNPSDYYVLLVLAYARGYETGVFTLPAPPPPPDTEPAHPHRHTPARTEGPDHPGHRPASQPSEAPGSTTPKPQPNPSPSAPKPPKPPKPKATPKPKPRPTPSPSGPPPPERVQVSGTWGTCASGYCLDGRAVDLAGVGTGGPAPSDFDGDGSVETRAQELDGLVGAPVTLLAQSSGSGAPLVLLVLNGHPWR